MSNNIKGITIELGGNTGPLATALKDVDKTSRSLQNELKEVNRELKFDPKNTDLLRQKQELLTKSTQTLKEKQDVLKQAVEQAHAQFEKGDLGADKVRAVEREYEKVTNQLKGTKQQLSEVEKTSGTFTQKIKAQFSNLKDSIKSTFNAENIKTAIGTIGIAVGSFLGISIKDAKEAGNTEANLTQTIKSTGGAAGMTAKQMEELAEKEMSVSTFSKDDIESGEAMLATFTKIGKDVFPQATQATLDYAQKMGVDAKSAAMTLGKALNDPVKGLSKLTKSGVIFTAQQQQQIKAMEKVGNVAGAQKLMIAELNREFGGQAAAAAKTYDGQQKQIVNDMNEVKESIGSSLLPILAQLGSYLVKLLQPIAKFVSENPKHTAAILAIVAGLGTLIGGMSALNSVLGLVGITLRTNQMLIVGGVMAAIIALIGAAILIATHWSQIKEKTAELINKFNEFKNNAIDKVKKAFQDLKNGVEGFGKILVNVKNNAINSVKQKFDEFEATLKKHQTAIKVTAGILGTIFGPALVKTGVQATVAGTKIAAGFIANLVKTGAQATASGTKISAGFIANMVKTGATAVVNGIKVSASFTASLIKSGAQAVVSSTKISAGFIASMARASAQAVVTGATITGHLIKAIVSYAAEGWKAVASIAKQTAAWAAQKIQVIASTVALGAYKIATVALTIATNGLTAAQNLLKIAFVSTPWGWVVLAIMGVVAAGIALYKNWDTVKRKASETWNGIRAAFAPLGSFAQKMFEWGKDMIGGFVSGIKAGFGAVGDAVGWIAGKISALLHHSKPDEGPMKDDDQWAPDFMKGIEQGIIKNKDRVVNAIKGLATDVSVGMKVTPAMAGIKDYSDNIQMNNSDIMRRQTPMQIIFKGNYCFPDKKMIDYFSEKVSNTIAYKALGRR